MHLKVDHVLAAESKNSAKFKVTKDFLVHFILEVLLI